MKKSLGRTALLAFAAGAALAAGVGASTLASAQPYYGDRRDYEGCRHERRGNTAAGAVIGGIAGALIGHGVSRGDDRGAGTAIGAGIGGTLGAGIGSSTSRCGDEDRYNRSYYDDRYRGYRPSYGYDGGYYSYPDTYYGAPRYYGHYDYAPYGGGYDEEEDEGE
jgi:hypothetical protein